MKVSIPQSALPPRMKQPDTWGGVERRGEEDERERD
jgi:hypothetical protein